MKIEIIEDDRLLGQALEIFLKKEGYETALARSCREARERLEPSVCLLLVDITLPDGDGIRLYRELTKSRPIPGIFLTARDEEEDMLAAFDAGADDYVVKPFPMQVLSRRIRAVLRRSEARQGPPILTVLRILCIMNIKTKRYQTDCYELRNNMTPGGNGHG